MKIISHRGNLYGPETKDNIASKIQEIAKKMLVEVDVWCLKDQWFLGHDKPENAATFDFISNSNFILHAKNLEALKKLTETDLHYFWHQQDDFTLTSKNFIWTYPSKNVTDKSIIVCRTKAEVDYYKSTNAWGICTDYVLDRLV